MKLCVATLLACALAVSQARELRAADDIIVLPPIIFTDTPVLTYVPPVTTTAPTTKPVVTTTAPAQTTQAPTAPAQTTQAPTTPVVTKASGCSTAYGQCGGAGWGGATCCEAGYTCQKSNDWYSQCAPPTQAPTTAPAQTTKAPTVPVQTTVPAQTTSTPQTQPVQTTAAPSTTKPSSGCSAVYGQCGGIGWTGPTCCADGSACQKSGDYYSQCVPGATGTTKPPVTTTAAPATTTPAPGLPYTFGTPTWLGSGCPDGTVAIVPSTDGQTVSVLFTAYNAETTADSARQRNACNLAVPVTIKPSVSVGIFKVEYRGNVYVPNKADYSAVFDAEYYWAGARGAVVSKTYGPGTDSDMYISNEVVTSSVVWSPCGASTNFRINSAVTAQKPVANGTVDEEVQIAIDSVDTSVKYGFYYYLVTKQC